MKVVFELPFYDNLCGGVMFTIALAKEMNAHIRFQSIQKGYPFNIDNWTSGLPDNTFPECDVCITFSDNPLTDKLLRLPQVNRVMCYFQSYGMNIFNEKRNASNRNVFNLCTTKKIEEAIKRDGNQVLNVGFGLEMSEFYDFGYERKNYLAILFHEMQSKRYSVAVKVADILFDKGIIEGVISFGTNVNYKKYKHPKGLISHYGNATKSGVAEVFNQCKAYLMPSVSEGLNLTPIESTLCACPAVICDGAIGEIFTETNCAIIEKNSLDFMEYQISGWMYTRGHAEIFEKSMRETIKGYTWKNTVNKIKEVL